MTTIAEKLVLLDNTKTEIHNAIETMGVDVAVDLPFSGYPEKILQINTGGAANPWTAPADWIDISAVNDNEINLLVTEGTGIAFSVVTASGTYSIDWGDGTVETDRVSGTIYQHQHLIGGTPCTLGYNTWKIRIYGATADITRWKVARHNYTNQKQYQPLLWAVFGTVNITDYSNCFYTTPGDVTCKFLQHCEIPSFVSCSSTINMFAYCSALTSVALPTSWGGVLSASYMFYGCTALSSVMLPTSWGSVASTYYMFILCSALTSITLPTSWGSVTNASFMFYGCTALSSITLPTSWGSVTNTASMFTNCFALTSITLPTTWGIVTNPSSMFYGCSALSSVTLPTSWGSVLNVSNMFTNCYALTFVTLPTSWASVEYVISMFSGCSALTAITLPSTWGSAVNASNMFASCFGLKTLLNTEYVGSQTLQVDFSYFLYNCEFLQSNVTINSLIKQISIYGGLGYSLKVTSIRLPNAGSLFAGTSPQVNVSYTNLAAADIDLLFGDLPILSGKTINITGCPGAATCTRSIATAKGWAVTG